MPFKDYDDVHTPLVLPVRGVEYTIPPVNAQDGIVLHRAADSGDVSGLTDADMQRMLLGDVAGKMREDGAPASAIRSATLTAYVDFRQGREAARIMWESDGDPKAMLPPVKPVKGASTRAPASGTARKKKAPSAGPR